MASPNKTRIQIATDSAFANIVHDVNGAYTTALQVAEDALPKGINLYARGMHGHPESGDSSWSSTVLFKIMVPYANELYYTAGDYTFTVPAGVTEVCIAATPGVDYSTAGELLKAYVGKTVACVAGNNAVPVGIDSITLSGKGAAGTSTAAYWKFSSFTPSNARITAPSTLASAGTTLRVTTNRGAFTLNRTGLTATTATYYGITEEGSGDAWNAHWTTVYYTKINATSTTGAATTAVVNGTTYTFPGGVGGAAAVTNHTVSVNPAIGTTINATLASGGNLSYSYSAYAINALGTLLGNNFTLSPIAADIGTYTGGIAAWRNTIPVTPGDTIPVHVSTGGAVNIIWGTGRSFPNSEA